MIRNKSPKSNYSAWFLQLRRLDILESKSYLLRKTENLQMNKNVAPWQNQHAFPHLVWNSFYGCNKLLNYNRILIYGMFVNYYNKLIPECAVVAETDSSWIKHQGGLSKSVK